MSRVAVVTGGASGIGLGVARQLAADGHRVAVLDRNAEAATAAPAALVGDGATALAVEVDVAGARSRRRTRGSAPSWVRSRSW